MKYIMTNFNHERLSIAVKVTQQARTALATAFEYCMKREAFGAPLINQPVVRHRLAKAGAQLETQWSLVESFVYQMSRLPKDVADVKLGGLTALAKAQAAIVLNECSQCAQLLFGGNGYTQSGQGELIEKISREVAGARIPVSRVACYCLSSCKTANIEDREEARMSCSTFQFVNCTRITKEHQRRIFESLQNSRVTTCQYFKREICGDFGTPVDSDHMFSQFLHVIVFSLTHSFKPSSPLNLPKPLFFAPPYQESQTISLRFQKTGELAQVSQVQNYSREP